MQEQIKKEQVTKDVIYEIQLEATRIKGERDGKKYDFLSFETYDKQGKKSRIKFTKDCKYIPTEEGTYLMKVNKKDINKDKMSRFSIYWVRKIEEITDYEQSFENDEDLPF